MAGGLWHGIERDVKPITALLLVARCPVCNEEEATQLHDVITHLTSGMNFLRHLKGIWRSNEMIDH